MNKQITQTTTIPAFQESRGPKTTTKLTNLLTLGINGLKGEGLKYSDSKDKYEDSEEFEVLTNLVTKLFKDELGFKLEDNQEDNYYLLSSSSLEGLIYQRNIILKRFI